MTSWGLFSDSRATKPVTVCFRIPYYTQWGQSLLVCGSERVLGSWDAKKGVLLSPAHRGGELVWYGSVAVPTGFSCEYSYYVDDDSKNVLRWEMGKRRKLLLPEGLRGGDIVKHHNLWQTGSDSLPFLSAFKDAIFNKSQDLEIERPDSHSP